MPTYIALLRGINVGGKNSVPMPELLSVCDRLGLRGARHYIRSGNLVFESHSTPEALETALEREISARFRVTIPVVVRSVRDWLSYMMNNPFHEAAAADPSLVMLALSKAPPAENAVEALMERAADGERVGRFLDGIWIHYPGGSGSSKLTPVLLDRCIGSPSTTRNWRTVLALADMASENPVDVQDIR